MTAAVEPPGKHLRRALRARGWTQADLAMILGRPERFVSELINGRRGLTARTALELGAALGDDPWEWMKREVAYRLSIAASLDHLKIRARVQRFQKRKTA